MDRDYSFRYNDLLMISRRAFCPAALVAAAGCGPRRGSGFPGYALVADEESRSVAAVDLTAFALRRRIPLGSSPIQVVAGRERGTAYVLSLAPGELCELNVGDSRVARRLRLPGRPASMCLPPKGDAVWVLLHEPAQLLRVPLASLQVDLRIALAVESAEFDVAPSGLIAAVTHPRGSVSLVDLAAGRVQHRVEAGDAAGAVCLRRDGTLALAADPDRRLVAAIQTVDGRVLTRLQVAVRPRRFCFKHDGGELFVTGDGMDAVVILNPYRTEVAETALAGRAPGAMAFSSSPEYLFVTNAPTGDVTILDPETRRVIAVVAVGAEPDFVTITPDDGYALILSRRSGTMAVVRPGSIVRSRQRGVALYTTIPVGSKPVSAAVVEV